ncbi:YfbU family protein [Megasphaera sueciensis]|uniref:YfbU family protein n=1 Tax=Megasphaera sueciensis TaxID=349094 RepID=UPI003CFFD433
MLIRQAITSGNTWALDAEYSFLNEEEPPKEQVDKVWDILSLWRRIQTSFEKLPDDDKRRVLDKTNTQELCFDGFDGNNEGEYSIATFIVEYMHRFEELKDKDLNSHCTTMDKYEKMLTKASRIPNETYDLSVEQILDIVE